MAKLPLEDKATGIHRAKTWEICLYAMNNASSNAYLILVNAITYYLIGIVGVVAVLASTLVTLMRVWDGVTDPILGMIVDKTDGKLGKNRPFIIIGQVIMFVTTLLMFRLVPTLPSAARFIAWLAIYLIYILGYTSQCIVTKSAQTCMTNDPKQRPVFAMFDSVFTISLMSVFFPVFQTSYLVPKFTITDATAEGAAKIAELCAAHPALSGTTTVKDGVTTLSAFYNPEMWANFQILIAILSAVLACCAIIGIWRKDRTQYYGTGKAVKISLRDYADVMLHNRAIQMLVVAASTDKLATLAVSNSTIMICLFGIICGNYSLYSSYTAITAIPSVIIGVTCIGVVTRKLGQKKSMVIGSLGAMCCAALLALWIILGNPQGMVLPAFSIVKPSTWLSLFNGNSWSLFAVIFVLLYIGMQSFSKMAGIVITMTADCADYEVYRSGRYVPGLMGTLFSFVDKIISSLSTTIIGLIFAAIGFGSVLPTVETPYSTQILVAVLVCYLGLPIVGWICNLIAMKFYPLTKEKMEEIQGEVARIKAEAEAETTA